ncbi:MAG: SDR family oxidoreductase, partial [Actinomycetota bacterium]
MGANEGRSIIVTGAASGIGAAAVRLLVAEGAKVVAVDLNEEALRWTRELDGVIPVAGSVTEPELNAAMVEAAVEGHGGLDAVALNAGILVQGDVARGSMDDFDRVMDVNVRAVALGLQACLPAMDAGGAVVVTGSVSGLRGDSGLFAYNASKGAAVNMARAAALGHAGAGRSRAHGVDPDPPVGDVEG